MNQPIWLVHMTVMVHKVMVHGYGLWFIKHITLCW